MEEDKENCVRVTRAMKRKAEEAAATIQRTPTKKRVVLGELPKLQNAVVPPPESSRPHQPKRKSKTKSRAAKKPRTPPQPDEIQTTPSDPQMCEPYARDIYEYLHKLEVFYIYEISRTIWIGLNCNIRDWGLGVMIDWG